MKLSYRNELNARIIAETYKKPLDKSDWYTIKAISGEEAEIFIYDYIGWPYNDAGELVRAMAEIKDTPILARLNSQGGDVFDGIAILNAFAQHPGGVTVRIESVAASIASVLAMGGRKVEAYQNTMMMIHNSWVLAAGNRKELIEVSDLLEQVDENMVDAYTGKTKLGKRAVRDMMDAETWMNAKTMKEKGFVDEVLKSGHGAKAEFDLSIYANAPDGIGYGTDDEKTEREKERALRDVGFSQKEAKAILAGRKEGAQRDVEEIQAITERVKLNLTGGK